MAERAPYSRVYWTIRSDDRLRDLYPDDHHLASWLRLLIAADMAWPAPADLPASVRASSVRVLEAAGVIQLLPGGLFIFHGLDAERGRRRDAAMASSANRSPTVRVPDGDRSGTGRHPNADLAEPSLDETSNPPTPTSGGNRQNGTNPRARGVNPRAIAEARASKSRRESANAQLLVSRHNHGAHADEPDPACPTCRHRQEGIA